MNSNPLRWGILGTANIARKNWHAIQNTGNSVVAGVASRDQVRSERFIQECLGSVPVSDRPQAFGSYEALLASPKIDAVYIPLPTGLRKEWVMRAAAAGKHVVCEKPCAISAADLREMIAACHRHNVQFMDGVMFVHGRRMQRLRELWAEGSTVGAVRRVMTQFTFRGDEAFAAENIRSHSGLEPHGCLGDLGWYSLVFSLEAFAGRMPRQVTGRTLATAGRPDSPSPIPSEFAGELFYEDGVSAAFYSSFLTENQQWAHVSGTRGQVWLNDFVLPFFGNETAFDILQPEFTVTGCDFVMESRARRVVIPEFSNNHPTAQETQLFRNFAEQVATGTLNGAWPERALKTQVLMEACWESAAQEGRPVTVRWEGLAA